VLVRTWNLFHGNTKPPQRRAFLAEMVRLATADDPDVVCLQELPVWSFSHLEAWSGMRAAADVAARPLLGSAELGRLITDLNHGLLRSLVTGQGNAILVARRHRVREHETIVLNPRSFRRAQARWLGLPWTTRLAWESERRICQAVRVERENGETLLVANLHATSYPADQRLADAELLRAAAFADGLARAAEPVVLAGDFNISRARSRTLRDLDQAEWGLTGATAHGIDHVLVRGARAEPAVPWPEERRRLDGRLLSDHAPVDRIVA
jgi:endonuclease/exonuclease/phosphatase family metal-dependent hydrolase